MGGNVSHSVQHIVIEQNLGLDGGANGVPLPLLELVFKRPGSVGEELEVMGSV